ncbi:MAG: glutathione synthase [Deltaproteobacteria bacterium]|nr:glutathione synthase [Deltaproteobacteria bacterium]
MFSAMSSHKIAFIADPLANFNPNNETTLVLMREALRRGFEIYHTEPKDLFCENGKVGAHFLHLAIMPFKPKESFYQILAKERCFLQDMAVVFLRKDPPFDERYLQHLQLLMLARGQVTMINDPAGILGAAEKILPLQFPELCPPTVISAAAEELMAFITQRGKPVVLKPLGLSGGAGITLLQDQDPMVQRAFLQAATCNFTRAVVAQVFLPGVKAGDKRIILWDGAILGLFNRIAKPGEFRSNLHAGGRAVASRLSPEDQKIVDTVGPELLKMGLRFVGLDVIAGFLTEINVTSPMGLAEINGFYGGAVERKIFDTIFA